MIGSKSKRIRHSSSNNNNNSSSSSQYNQNRIANSYVNKNTYSNKPAIFSILCKGNRLLKAVVCWFL